ncbi:MAG: enoyl-CoA hydratase-related protein [Gammaproteobacteria bacterium]
MSYENILFETRDNIARITLNRPDKLNALSMHLLEEFHDALRIIARSPDTRALIITGAGRAFAAGLDLTAKRPEDPDALLRDYFTPSYALLKDLSIPTIAAVNGPSVGAAMSMALSCDIVVAAKSAYFLAAFVNIALVPDNGASWFLPHSIGYARAMGMLMLGERLPAEQAAEWGLVWKCVEDDQLAEVTDAMARKLAAGPSTTYAYIKRMVAKSITNDLPIQIGLENEYQRMLRGSPNVVEAITAFAEKRPPKFGVR